MKAILNWAELEGRLKGEATATESKLGKKIDKKIDLELLGGLRGGGSKSGANAKSRPSMREIAEKYKEILIEEIESHESTGNYQDGNLSYSAVKALTNIKISDPTKLGRGRYSISLSFANDLTRESLFPDWTDVDGYPPIDNIAALLNNGYKNNGTEETKNYVYGWVSIWGGVSTRARSLRQRQGAHFMGNSRLRFMTQYATPYGVTDVKVDPVYTL